MLNTIDINKHIIKCSEDIYNKYINNSKLKMLYLENASKCRISVNIMTFNEERCIKRAIDSIYKIADEIIIIDTGSTDDTIKIINKYFPSIQIYERKWVDNFSKIRNEMIKLSNGDWIIQLDADEYLDNQQELRRFIEYINIINDKKLIISPCIINHDNHKLYQTKRVFRNIKEIRYFGAVHEELRFLNDPSIELKHILIDIAIYHDGYMGNIINNKNKFERNIKLLHSNLENEKLRLKWNYFMGRELYYKGDLLKADEYLNKAINCVYINKEDKYYFQAALVIIICIKFQLNKLEEIDNYLHLLKKEKEVLDSFYFDLLIEQFKFEKTIKNKIYFLTNELATLIDTISYIHSECYHIYYELAKVCINIEKFELASVYINMIKDKNFLMKLKKELNIRILNYNKLIKNVMKGEKE